MQKLLRFSTPYTPPPNFNESALPSKATLTRTVSLYVAMKDGVNTLENVDAHKAPYFLSKQVDALESGGML